MTHKAIICGGSLGGLFVAAALLRTGWDVTICERTETALSGRGAGIVTHEELLAALDAVGAGASDLGVMLDERVAYDLEGARVRTLPYRQLVTSWDRVYQILKALVPEHCYRFGWQATGYRNHRYGVTVSFANGATETADLCVGSDGFRSAIRAQMLPDVTSEYAGYVVWRAVAQEADLSAAIRETIFPNFGLFVPNGAQIIGYPIAGRNNDLREGHRQYNFVWYARVDSDALADMLTDGSGHRHAISIPPPLVREEVISRAMAEAARRLPRPFVDILKLSERPFFTPIYDHHAPVMMQGRVALTGDAACVARPHAGMGVTKAAQDALALARHLESTADVSSALRGFSDGRVTASRRVYERSRKLGSLIFDTPADENHDGRSHAHLDTVMRETAVVV